MSAPAFEMDHIAVHAGSRCLFSARQLQIPAGSLCAIIGPNGAGKTTLLRALAGFHGHCHGRSLGQPLRAGQPRPLAWVGQHEGADSPLCVADYVMLGRRPQLGWLGRSSAADQQAVARALDSMALQGLAGQRLATLSGGERQRAAIARALAQDTPLMLLDEPCNHLDIRHQQLLLRQLQLLAQQGRTLVCVLHELQLAANYADWLLLVADGQLVAQGTPEALLHGDLLSQVYRWPIRAERQPATGRWQLDVHGHRAVV